MLLSRWIYEYLRPPLISSIMYYSVVFDNFDEVRLGKVFFIGNGIVIEILSMENTVKSLVLEADGFVSLLSHLLLDPQRGIYTNRKASSGVKDWYTLVTDEVDLSAFGGVQKLKSISGEWTSYYDQGNVYYQLFILRHRSGAVRRLGTEDIYSDDSSGQRLYTGVTGENPTHRTLQIIDRHLRIDIGENDPLVQLELIIGEPRIVRLYSSRLTKQITA